MLKIYGSEMCPDCIQCKKNFDIYNVEYEFIDINKSLHNLKVFLDYRDHNPIFDRLKAIGDIGLPAIVKQDGEVFTDWETYLRNQGKEPVYEDLGESCSINGKGC